MTNKVSKKELFSTAQVAEILGMSRIAVFKHIQSGTLHAVKVGRSYVVEKEELMEFLGNRLKKEKKDIDASVKKTIEEYGETLRKLGKE